jgi:hypothetical protein
MRRRLALLLACLTGVFVMALSALFAVARGD